jgi:hypothetical protein
MTTEQTEQTPRKHLSFLAFKMHDDLKEVLNKIAISEQRTVSNTVRFLLKKGIEAQFPDLAKRLN